jgi:hypothetical protein
MKFFSLFLLVTSLCFSSETVCYFKPPPEWSLADPSLLSKRVKIAFLGKGKKGFYPSINLTIEEVDVSLAEYVKAVKAIHERDPAKQWRNLGHFKTAAGEAVLTAIDTKNGWGPIRLLQLLFVKEKTAYILTACALKEDFPQFYQAFQPAFRSLTLTSDLIEEVNPPSRRDELKKRIIKMHTATHEEQELFRKAILDDFCDMGSYWQLLLIGSLTQKQD